MRQLIAEQAQLDVLALVLRRRLHPVSTSSVGQRGTYRGLLGDALSDGRVPLALHALPLCNLTRQRVHVLCHAVQHHLRDLLEGGKYSRQLVLARRSGRGRRDAPSCAPPW